MYSHIVKDLRTLSTAAGVAGHPDIVCTAKEKLSMLTDDCYVDAMGNLLAVRHCDDPNAPTILLEAHLDEIGFMVTHIDDSGFIHVAPAGGIDQRVLAGCEVVVYGEHPYPGVFCSVPPHLSKEEGALPDISERGVDIGMTAEEARKSVPLGSRVAFAPVFKALNDFICSGKALDDRAGMAAILHALRLTADEDLPCHVAVAFCVQEELGTRGAAPAVRALAPTMAIATDVSFAMTPGSQPHQCGELGKGPMIGIAPILSQNMTNTLFALAKEEDIPYQTEVMAGSTGTDADAITVTGTGVPTALLSIPQRYMHTPVETVDVRDVAAVGMLMAAFMRRGGAENE